MLKRMFTLSFLAAGMATFVLTTSEALSQPVLGKGGGGRSAGHAAPSAHKPANAGPAMTRPAGGPQAPDLPAPRTLESRAGTPSRPNVGAVGSAKPNGGFQRPSVNGPRKCLDGVVTDHRSPARPTAPEIGGERPGPPGHTDCPNVPARPGSGPSSSQLNDFLGGNGGPSEGNGRPELGKADLPNVGKDEPPR